MQSEVVIRARELAQAALAFAEASRQRINDLNVYPVPDGDTGTNIVATVRGVVETLAGTSAQTQADVAAELQRAALRAAKGNSGVILSQIVRGFADVLAECDEIDSPALARAFRGGTDAAYRAVREPAEGTMLTVIREMAEEGELAAVQVLPCAEFMTRIVDRGERALQRTPDMLPVLKLAGVVDAGGAALVELARGIDAGIARKPLPTQPVQAETLGFDAVHQELSRYRYCTAFLVDGIGIELGELERELQALGDSLLVVGDASTVKVHVHTDDPGAALRIGTRVGALESVEIANMHRQTLDREKRLSAGASVRAPARDLRTALVAVVPGAGNRELFESEGATYVIDGGQTMNPSAGQIQDAIDAVPADAVLVLPNNANVVLAAQQAASLSPKAVRVVPSRSVQEGLGAIVQYEPEKPLAANEAVMREAMSCVRTGEVTRASRTAHLDGVEIREGAWLGLVADRIVACDESLDAVVEVVVERLLEGDRGLLTLLTGDGSPDLGPVLEMVEERHPGVEVEVHAGGQPHYPLLLSAE
ncbi:MAG TPA: DAK2 domain-containing protein [Gaiellaceae bacterium]